MQNNIIKYTLHLADNNLIMSQRLSEWTGHGPALEQDIALTNIALDLLGQSRNFYQYAARLVNEGRCMKEFLSGTTYPVDEDAFAFHRLEHQFNSHLLVELPNGDWAHTVGKLFFFSVYQQLLYGCLQDGNDAQIAAIAQKSLKEVKYHVKWSADWVLRLGDGTEESHERMKNAMAGLWPFTGELFETTPWNSPYVQVANLKENWYAAIKETLETATLTLPDIKAYQTGGLRGVHTENLGYILAEMQYLQRVYPGNEW